MELYIGIAHYKIVKLIHIYEFLHKSFHSVFMFQGAIQEMY